ncbi:hypothetical protein HRR83_007775 [Exophiala dermatitidis]|uniref:Uncharacterized protein n=3 Tax=Exophiala dermatitidis TaxID=5970 RepID=H6BTY4_EXODN|nr:uncharacterized protein HMPREF1120_03693 [Exophiala dermatitidis NIH/UT8656]KAJ4539238.1 hypothetical protein HRR77_006648 [Exophiala dermatitidis]EHY55561.1 hypothetical protein HMPREF1120_03693 [Exophiala dermatitidis NIH/UT8656]KAJ4540480.1 hypothetical protein HRR76_003874 [Exophiala dermatitidis]KAJ4564686.1 hypothetical protein HRR79_005939 [Exophiala dermatitidis]KAJ4565573.1 hypothetical protein HRR81_007738 [Exophiala dermatitidis]
MMPPTMALNSRTFNPAQPANTFRSQWKHPGDVFTILLIIGGDVVARALAQLTGSPFTPVAFSFGWVAYGASAVVSAIGENKLMPLPDCSCIVINGKSGYVRENISWIIGRIVRDFEGWRGRSDPQGRIRECLNTILNDRWEQDRAKAEKTEPGSGEKVGRPIQAGLCVSIYKAGPAVKGCPGYDLVYWMGFVTTIIQLGIAAIPCAVFGDWGIFLITIAGILLSFITGGLPQWREEKWACREHSDKNVILTRGNGSQHAIVVLGDGKGLDLEDLAAGQTNVDVSASWVNRFSMILLATLWILLLITAAGIEQNTWFLLAIGGLGLLQNVFVAGYRRYPEAYGVPLILEDAVGSHKVMDALYAVEERYPQVGASMLETFFPGKLRPDEEKKWEQFAADAKTKRSPASAAKTSDGQNSANIPKNGFVS